MDKKIYLYHLGLKVINCLIPKKKNKIYCVPHSNGAIDMYDMCNFGSDNLLCVLAEVLNNTDVKGYTFYVECYEKERFAEITEKINQRVNQENNWVIVKSYLSETSTIKKAIRRMRNNLIRFGCKLWLIDTPYCYFSEKVKSQKCICLGYCTPLKRVKAINDELSFGFIDAFYQPSLLTASLYSSDFQIPLSKFQILGFPRNDVLLSKDKSEVIKAWIRKKTDADYEKLIVYAPTYRDYENAYLGKCIFGYEDSEGTLEKFLEENKIIVISKMHPLQKLDNRIYSRRVLEYEKNFDFSLYDVLALSDMLVSDYSSVIHDYLITNKPIIMNFFDRNMYDESRGFAYEPMDYICPSEIVESMEELKQVILDNLSGVSDKQRYKRVREMFHRYQDACATERAIKQIFGE